MIDGLTDYKLMVYESKDNESIVNQSMTDELTVFKPTVLQRSFLIIEGHSTHRSVELFQFARNYNISLICFPAHAIHYLQLLDVGIFQLLANAYCLKLDQSYQTGNTNIN